METAVVILLADTFMAIFWVVGELLIKAFDLELADEKNGGYKYQARLDEAERQQHIQLAADRRKNIRHAPEWNEQLRGWQERKKLQKKVSGLNSKAHAYGFYAFFWMMFFLSQFWVFLISPKFKYVPRQYGTAEYYLVLIRQMAHPTIGSGGGGAYNLVIWSVVFLEAVLFFAAAAIVKWPKPPLIRGMDGNVNTKFYEATKIGTDNLLTVKPRDFFKKEMGIVNLVEDEHGGLIQDTCLLVACHMSCLTPERTHTFTATIKSALKVFPAHAIFVCDNGPWNNPVDRTPEVCTQISREHDPTGRSQINYLLIPEGNKSHAMYWTTEYWIPELVRRGELQEYQFALMIDDDVPLPPDLHVPNNTLNRNPAIKAVAYVIKAATEDGSENSLVSVQDLEYKMAGFIKQFQWMGGTTVCCHGAIALWRRDVLGSKILWDHDTVFHGEDLYMGLLLHRMRANYGIMVSASAIVPTFAPERMLILFRQRVTSWDLCAQRKFMSYFREVVFGWCAGTRAWIIKPFMLQECLNIVVDWLRLYLVFGLALLNPFSLLVCFVVFYAILYFEISIFNWGVLRGRPDLQVPARTIMIFPMYRTFCMLFRLYALMRNVLQYTTWRRKNLKISKREETIQDMPPVPPVIDPDWHTIWHPSTNASEGASLVSLTERLVLSLGIHNMTDRRRITLVVQAYMLYSKLLKEDALADFPASLKVLDKTDEDSKNHIVLLGKAMEALRKAIPKKLKQMVQESGDWEYFRSQLQNVMKEWEIVPETLFYNESVRLGG